VLPAAALLAPTSEAAAPPADERIVDPAVVEDDIDTRAADESIFIKMDFGCPGKGK